MHKRDKKLNGRALAVWLAGMAIGLPSAYGEPANTQATADQVFAMARTLSEDGPLYVYDIEVEVDGVVARGAVDMTAPIGRRLTVMSPPREQWKDGFDDEVDRLERKLEGDLWCQQMLRDVVDYEAVSVGDAAAIFRVTLGDNDSSDEDRKFAGYLSTTLTLDTTDGAVLEYSITARKPFRPVLIAKIKRLDINVQCERSPDGRTYAQSMSAEIEGRALMKSFSEREWRKVSNLRLP